MGLKTYNAKRDLSKTPEPAGGKASGPKLLFVIQKHHASHLHYDFRLEIRGVLKSWAVPKGPSMDPQVKRLAMLVEDHPYDYKDFEGIIPKGNYGAGTVIIWDQGTYEPADFSGTKEEQEKNLLKQFHSGKMKIIMKGKKLKGEFMLIRSPHRGENSWLLGKVKDRYASKADVSKLDKSVVSGKTLEQLASSKHAREWESNRKADGTLKKQKPKGRKAPMPINVSPMLCTLTKTPPQDEEYIYEIKWDGYRIVSFVNASKVKMHSRSGLDYTKKYPPVAKALKELGHKMVVDGEVVVLNEQGLPDFDALQLYNGHDTPIVYYVFDILWLDGYDLKALSLLERKDILSSLIGENEVLKISESFEDGQSLYERSIELNLEGIVAKKKESEYHEGERAYNWLKIPTRKRQEFVIGGWAESDRARSFRSLLFGAYNNGKLEWIGRSGGGYKEREMPEILAKLKKLEIKSSPFENKVLDTKGAVIHWVKPELVANFEFATWTKSGRIRKPATFLGFRKDKKAKDVVREIPKLLEADEKPSKPGNKTAKRTTSKGSNWPKLEDIVPGSESSIEMDDCSIKLTDVEKEIWKGVTKADLISYYHSMSKYILPYLKDRPLSLHIKNKGPHAPGLYIKDMEGRQPECAVVFTDKRRHAKEGKRDEIDYLVCNNEATLVYMINLGCIDVNPWMSKYTNPEQPDFINIDLDPSDDDFEKVIEVAQAAKKVLDAMKLKAFPKTSGKTGIHIYIPVAGIDFKVARDLSERIGKEIQKLVPKISTLNVSINARGNKVFIDPSQNDYADTLASVYCVRPNRVPTVSAPLEWKEIKSGLDPNAFKIDTIAERIKKKGDLFKDVLNASIARRNTKILEALAA